MIDRGVSFRDLHVPGTPFILANAWDTGSARMLAAMGAKALATSSAAHAFTLGVPDMGHVPRDVALTHASDLVAATPLPVSGDLENGYGHDAASVAETVTLAAKAGLAGCCIEDTMLPADTPYDFAAAVERIEAGAAAAKAAEGDFVLTARADGVMLGHYDLDEAIRRLKAFAEAGADVLYAPMVADMDALQSICRAVSKPVNALCAGRFSQYGLADFARIGVARVSLGSALARATHKIIHDTGLAMFERGDMTGLGATVSSDIVDPMLRKFID
ncbi:isocitrate lyase/PEP mutase family protein [Mariluticola halotolerans]|uniref:isocitrate lyase/PEP mutase family protein n=1 Tax=Mariluticola halotolerans TaxID=2909283 RepID=UPI0026E2EE5D|nr:isocitrate lyase/phosphoenolpyruvate mutase family protein [Mariluticola halotolerans]UJQ93863.1 isocitrate lyase/phosphoenolpyruvate mutase family protein [Mariluticola halotolerans]